MIKILIADDEYLVRLGLKTTINWEENGFHIVGEAKNGKEAIELFEKFNPDILLTDIRMPVMGGLELIQVLKQRKKALKAVILSHYDDFQYAREAIKLGASEYMLKSDLTSEILLDTLKRLVKDIDRSADGGNGTENMGEVMGLEQSSLLDVLVKRIINGDFKTEQELLEGIAPYERVFKYEAFAFVYGSIEDISNVCYEKEKDFSIGNIRNITSQEFKGKNLIYSLFVDRNYFILFLNLPGNNNSINAKEVLKELCLQIKRNLKQFLDIEMNLGLSEISINKAALPDLYEQAIVAQRYCFFELKGLMIFDKFMLQVSEECPRISLEILKGYVKTLSNEKIYEYINTVFEKLFELKQMEYVKDVFIDFLSYAKIIFKELDLKRSPALNETKFNYNNFDRLYNFSAVNQYILDLYHSMTYYSADSRPDSYSFIISKSIDYIKQKYMNNITLSDAADYVEISKSYLSLLFKQETGINFTTFLTNYRIEIAKKILVSSNGKIYEIAQKVGFENPYYFSKVFKDVTGKTCKDFKKSYYLKESYELDS